MVTQTENSSDLTETCSLRTP